MSEGNGAPPGIEVEEGRRIQAALDILVDFFGAIQILAESDDRFYYVGRGPQSWRYGMVKKWMRMEEADIDFECDGGGEGE